MQKLVKGLFLLTLISMPLVAKAGVHNKLEEVDSNVNPDEYFEQNRVGAEDQLSSEEIQLQNALKKEAEKTAKEAEMKAKLAASEAEALIKAAEVREAEINSVDSTYKQGDYKVEVDEKCGFFCTVWKVISYPARAIGRLF